MAIIIVGEPISPLFATIMLHFNLRRFMLFVTERFQQKSGREKCMLYGAGNMDEFQIACLASDVGERHRGEAQVGRFCQEGPPLST